MLINLSAFLLLKYLKMFFRLFSLYSQCFQGENCEYSTARLGLRLICWFILIGHFGHVINLLNFDGSVPYTFITILRPLMNPDGFKIWLVLNSFFWGFFFHLLASKLEVWLSRSQIGHGRMTDVRYACVLCKMLFCWNKKNFLQSKKDCLKFTDQIRS